MKARQHYYFFVLVILTLLLLFFAHEFLPNNLRRNIFQFPAIDTIGHLTSFFILTWVCHSIIKLPLLFCIFLLTFYAGLTEIGQSFLSFRSGQFDDFFADVIGILLFVATKFLYRYYVKTANKSTNKNTSNTTENENNDN